MKRKSTTLILLFLVCSSFSIASKDDDLKEFEVNATKLTYLERGSVFNVSFAC